METTFDDYTADSNPDLINPERGMYSVRLGKPNFGNENLPPDQRNYHTIVPEWLWLAACCDKDLVWDPTNPDNTSQVLKDYAGKLESARLNGHKILFRPRYDQRDPEAQEGDPPGGPSDCTFDGGSAKVFHADSKVRQFNHIDAVAAMLGDYKDVIAFIQAGYLGNWGEWNTEQGGDDPDPFVKENAPLLFIRTERSDIIDHVLLAYAAEGIAQDVELRTPVFAKEVVVRWEENPAIYDDASANVGLHNDCFMSSEDINGSDSGTYSWFLDFLDFSDFSDYSPQNLSRSLLRR